MDEFEDIELHANARFQLTCSTDQMAALIVIVSALKHAFETVPDAFSNEDIGDVADAIRTFAEVKPVLISK